MSINHNSTSKLVAEFIRALFDRHSYMPHKNLEFIFGFLWGLPIPLFTFGIHIYATGESWNFQTCLQIIRENPIYIFFVVHPLLFAIIFGAHGTMRTKRDLQIKALIADLEMHCDELFRANEKLTEVDRLKSEFLANVTHELKSPLVTALGYSDRILNEKLGPVTERQKNALSVSKRNLIRLRGLIEEILDFSRLEAGVGKFTFEQINLKELIDAACNDLILKARERNIAINCEFPGAPALVCGDKIKLTQAIENLVDNAIKFSPDGKDVRISVKPEGDCWLMRIEDRGVGIDPDRLAKLFQRFSQADGSVSRPYNGVGLGLVIVKKIIEAHGGQVWLESQPGAGTTAIIRLKQFSNAVENESETEVAHVTRAIG